ncbi:MAG: hypothetical protein JO247_16530 [Chloroflexi bacterium]|nr:hypothetical protein [Chloroflexota bacterium]
MLVRRRRSLKYWLFRLAEALVPCLPASWAAGLAEAIGLAAFMFGRRARLTAQTNVAAVIGDEASRAVVRRMFVHNAEYYLSLFTRRPKGFRLDDHELTGWQHFRDALDMGRGCLLVSPHLGDINYYAELFIASGFGVNVLVEHLRPPRFSDLVVSLRQRRGVNVIVGGVSALRQVYRALDRNEIVAMISDRDVAGEGQETSFFGRPARMPATAFAIGARRQTPVVFGCAVKLPGGRIVTDVREPFVPTSDLPAEVARMAGVFQEFICRWPDQWLAFQPVFHG